MQLIAIHLGVDALVTLAVLMLVCHLSRFTAIQALCIYVLLIAQRTYSCTCA